jgi:tetratricopeptide (TPR) repeat protein
MDQLRRRVGPLLLVVLAAAGPARAAATLDEAVRLQRDGHNVEARDALRELVPALRATGDRAGLARALSAASEASIALGEYETAIAEAREALVLHRQLGRSQDAAWDLNAVGLASLYLGRYDDALASYESALALDRAAGDGDGETTRLNNMGNVHYMRGRYGDARRLYEEAMAAADGRTSDAGRARLRKMSLSNLAVLHQRLGAYQRALDLYGRLHAGAEMLPSEEAQLLANQGTLLRRLGDPVKAMEMYRRAQGLFAGARHRDGETGVLRNMGIAYALDLHDSARALEAFDAALALARASSNRRAEVLARLYRGETLRRLGRRDEASAELETALRGAVDVGLVEEQWKARYGLGRLSEAAGDAAGARRSYEQAIAAIESVRSDVQAVALRSEFLADKRDVYDALIALRLSEASPSAAEVFALVEQSRARAWQDRLQDGAAALALTDVQARIAPGTLLLEHWSGPEASAVVWVSSSAAGIARQASSAAEVEAVRHFAEVVAQPGDEWRTASLTAGRILLGALSELARASRLLVVPDGPLHFVPFEALTLPGAPDLVVDRFEISYLPSAALLVHRRPAPPRRWMWPWQLGLIAFGDPPPPAAAAGADPVPRLSHADEELRAIAGIMPSRTRLHVGPDARKRALQSESLAAPLLHFATHAIADTRDPDRSRILLAPSATEGAADDLFLREIYDLDLRSVQLATLSACETERGKVIRGEGVEGFSRALLAAGAASAVTTLWDVADRASAEFMKQFYFALAQGESETSALRQAKLQFLHSRLPWSHPRYWAGYVLNGEGGARLPRVVPWMVVAGVPALALLALGAGAYRRVERRRRQVRA